MTPKGERHLEHPCAPVLRRPWVDLSYLPVRTPTHHPACVLRAECREEPDWRAMSDDKYEAVFTTYVHGNGRRAVGRVGVAIIRNATACRDRVRGRGPTSPLTRTASRDDPASSGFAPRPEVERVWAEPTPFTPPREPHHYNFHHYRLHAPPRLFRGDPPGRAQVL